MNASLVAVYWFVFFYVVLWPVLFHLFCSCTDTVIGLFALPYLCLLGALHYLALYRVWISPFLCFLIHFLTKKTQMYLGILHFFLCQYAVIIADTYALVLSLLKCNFNQIGPEQIEALYQYAKFQFECGNYSGAADYLYQYRGLCTNSERSLSALWGKLAAEILMQNWDVALEELNRLKEIIDSKVSILPELTWIPCLKCVFDGKFFFYAEFCISSESSPKQNMANALESLHLFQPWQWQNTDYRSLQSGQVWCLKYCSSLDSFFHC